MTVAQPLPLVCARGHSHSRCSTDIVLNAKAVSRKHGGNLNSNPKALFIGQVLGAFWGGLESLTIIPVTSRRARAAAFGPGSRLPWSEPFPGQQSLRKCERGREGLERVCLSLPRVCRAGSSAGGTAGCSGGRGPCRAGWGVFPERGSRASPDTVRCLFSSIRLPASFSLVYCNIGRVFIYLILYSVITIVG